MIAEMQAKSLEEGVQMAYDKRLQSPFEQIQPVSGSQYATRTEPVEFLMLSLKVLLLFSVDTSR